MEDVKEALRPIQSQDTEAENPEGKALRIAGKAAEVVAEAYFAPKLWEKNGTVYRWMGVRTFKRYIPSGDAVIRMVRRGGGSHLGGFSLPEPTLDAAKKYDRYTRIWETVHAAGLAAAVTRISMSLTDGAVDKHTFINVATGLVNLYPVMLQRYNRARIYGLLKRAEKQEENKNTNPNSTGEPHTQNL
ncbi:MAG: hypothetical protein UU23_C0001G0108 [Candidatus Curtissbacteria bacterium GW2011_GWA1_40_9]|uniref:Glycosyl-4,4'-diaponeurosporenoate acyltransferase n=1 Tax=Candidatus Curtissbacteria bacterium GW2011_GWA1_40_9 TaxID=1618408 RepID=A0A0G0TMS3_9BACT|nr:MAG: hypothetical protein UU23_C0001G0108 [Candidatus Curtissbacteria bacterium GW2011_GWA1_40_9]